MSILWEGIRFYTEVKSLNGNDIYQMFRLIYAVIFSVFGSLWQWPVVVEQLCLLVNWRELCM